MIMNYKNSVLHVLTLHESARDSDLALYYFLLFEELKEDKEITVEQLLVKQRDGKLPTFDVISRCRRKCQEENPHLRGTKYEKRHGKVKEVQAELGYKSKFSVALDQSPSLNETFENKY